MELEQWIRENPDEALDIVNTMTGHDIFDPVVLDAMPDELQEQFVQVHESDHSHHKSTIYVDGEPVDELEGVNGRLVLRRFKNALGLETKSFIGRGFQAQADSRAIREELENKVDA